MKKPEKLKKGDSVAIVSLSSGIAGDELFSHRYELGKKRLEDEFGLKVVTMPNALIGSSKIYNHPELRAEDLMEAFKRNTSTKYGLQLTMITTYGVKNNKYSSIMGNQITLEDLFDA